jgi:exodeoxyribonuclease V alpha subunit
VTRAKSKVRGVGSEPSVRSAIERRALRATGLRERLHSSAASLRRYEEDR